MWRFSSYCYEFEGEIGKNPNFFGFFWGVKEVEEMRFRFYKEEERESNLVRENEETEKKMREMGLERERKSLLSFFLCLFF